MKILIAKRGNIAGPQPELENTDAYICNALSRGFHCEIDVWFQDGRWFLGHDEPIEEITLKYMKDKRLWVHLKNIEAARQICSLGNEINFFWHQEDDIAVTSSGFLWTYPGKELTVRSIAVLPERVDSWEGVDNAAGICSDYIGRYI